MLRSSRPVVASRRSTGTPSARLADSFRRRRSPPEEGSSPLLRAVTAASQSMAAMATPLLVACSMKRPVKSAAVQERAAADEQGDAGFERVEPGGACLKCRGQFVGFQSELLAG